MDDAPGSITSENIRLTTALRKPTLNYVYVYVCVYDFGGYWEHRIKVEKALAPIQQLVLLFCVGGACATPPEDCGGVPGYAEFVQAMADPDDPEHDNLAEWNGTDTWDPAAFDTIEVNDRLAANEL